MILALGAAGAWAQEAEHIGTFGDWDAIKNQEGGQTFCYIATAPKKAQGKYTKRGKVYVTVTHWPGEKRFDEIGFRAGYTLKQDSLVKVTIGSFAMDLRTEGGWAWTSDAKQDKALVRAMKGGSSMVVKGTSSRGTLTTDTYSLTGITAAYNAMGEACGVK